MEEKLSQLRGMVVTALFVNYKLDEDPIMRSTITELLKPLAIKELKTFMLTLTKTPRNYRSVLEIVSDVVDDTIKQRFSNSSHQIFVQSISDKLHALVSFANTQLKASNFENESDFLHSLDFSLLKSKQEPLFDAKELFVIKHITLKALLMLLNDEPFLLEKRLLDALHLYENEIFKTQNYISPTKKSQTNLENINEPEIIEALAHDKRV